MFLPYRHIVYETFQHQIRHVFHAKAVRMFLIQILLEISEMSVGLLLLEWLNRLTKNSLHFKWEIIY